MRVFLTGGTGFIGRHIAALLSKRQDRVVALARSPDRASALHAMGCELVEGDLADVDAIRRGLRGCDAVIHSAAIYKVGIPASERPGMFDTNVRGTERVLDAAIEVGTPRIVYVSTVNVFGNTRGRVVDETYRRPETEGFLSAYDETKFLAHREAETRIQAGAPVVIAQPGLVYGQGDHSEVGGQIERMRRGRLPALAFPDLGCNFLHVDDAAEGVVRVLDRGSEGRAYVLGGEIGTLRKLIQTVARLSGRRPPILTIPAALVRMSIPLAPVVTRAMRLPPNLREIVRASDGVTYWATDARARGELGYAPRGLEDGLRQMLAR